MGSSIDSMHNGWLILLRSYGSYILLLKQFEDIPPSSLSLYQSTDFETSHAPKHYHVNKYYHVS
jgi:hypothetical protein